MWLLILGLIGLWLGTKFVINGAEDISRKFNLSHTFVGLTILAIGTDLPEIFVTLKAAIMNSPQTDTTGIIAGNAIGSCISQITIILGISGLVMNFSMSKEDLKRNGITLIASIALLLVFAMDGLVSTLEGITLISVYIIYYIILIRSNREVTEANTVKQTVSNLKIVLTLLVGFAILIFSSHLVVENALLLAEKWGVRQSFIGIAVVGLGTSLPELVVSVGAAIRKSAGMSVGNIIGSNIFDGLIPIGLSSLITETKVEDGIVNFDLPALLIITIFVMLCFKDSRNLGWLISITLIAIYAIYIYLKYLLFGNI